jgi:hypothetical protein
VLGMKFGVADGFIILMLSVYRYASHGPQVALRGEDATIGALISAS